MIGDGSGIGPVEAVVSQISIGFAALAWTVTEALGTEPLAATVPLIGLFWTAARYRARTSEQETEQDVVEHDQDGVETDSVSVGAD